MADVNVGHAFSAIVGSYGGEQFQDPSDDYQVRMKIHGALRIFGIPLLNGQTNNFESQPFGWDTVVELTTADFTIPPREQEKITVPYLNGYTTFLGKPTDTGEFNWTGTSVVGRDVYARLNLWMEQGFNQHTMKVGRASKYRKNGYAIKFGPDFDSAHNETWELRSVIINKLEQDGVDMNASGDVVKITATLHADQCIYRGMNWDGSDSAFGNHTL